ncbi:hypothetical protein QCE47_28120 [Caballeronia sp. LZ025]|uniref:hypothetical protein n=1 Tax=Caballeronia TaxID=1827195 RepID=UPI001FD15442|nr:MULTISPECIES: hypothetical protein [Caballeronia]MDR5736183.1 hypothetical protein [Caballeronia sp. LZ025]
MIELITNNKRENIILFVHGFTGGKETWKHPKSGYFFDQLQQFDLVQKRFDIAVYEYFSTLSNLLADTSSMIGRVLRAITRAAGSTSLRRATRSVSRPSAEISADSGKSSKQTAGFYVSDEVVALALDVESLDVA